MEIVVCSECGSRNRENEALSSVTKPVCGRCRAPLAVGDLGGGRQPLVVTDATFEREVLEAGQTPVLLDCWAAWCGPCRMLAPVVDQLAAESEGQYRIAKLNTDENPAVAQRLRIDALPTLLFFKQGKLVDKLVGLAPKPAIAEKLHALL